MDIEAELEAPCPPGDLFDWVSDLARYPQWLEIVTEADPVEEGIWAVDLRGRMGPLARTKRLRMVRTEHRAPTTVVFERDELDERDHSPWRLAVQIHETSGGSHLHMHLHYGGGLFQPVIERVLKDEIEKSRHRLLALVSPDGG